MAKLTRRQLQATLNALVAANNRAADARDKIMAHCEIVYGTVPGDIDNDRFIDAVDSGCGRSTGMTVDEFHESMLLALEIR